MDRVLSMDRELEFPGGTVPATAVVWRFDPSGGPGGQHANRARTRVEAVIDLTTAGDIDSDVRERLIEQFGTELRTTADDSRSQARNREIALDRMQARLLGALSGTKPRRATRPSSGARARRLQTKRRRSETKRGRSRIDPASHER